MFKKETRESAMSHCIKSTAQFKGPETPGLADKEESCGSLPFEQEMADTESQEAAVVACLKLSQ